MSFDQYRPQRFQVLPLVIKNLLIINGLLFLATFVFRSQFNIDLDEKLGLHYFSSPGFRPYQIVTYMFMHANIQHIALNMFALWMFGNTLENFWGPKRFLTYYMVTGIGAALVQLLVAYIRLHPLLAQVPPDALEVVQTKGYEMIQTGYNFADPTMAEINAIVNGTTIGASGAVFGVLLAFGMLFPNTVIYLYFAIPMKAKWFVVLYGLLELGSGLLGASDDNVAHFAHLGGMLFGFILVRYWQRNKRNFY